MNVHKKARLTPLGRERLVLLILDGRRPATVARESGVWERTARKWLARFKAEGVRGLADRSSRPRRLNRPTPEPVVERIGLLRRGRMTGRQIAQETGISPATVSRVLNRIGLNRLAALDPPAPVRRYERERPGDMIHIDIKKLGRFEKPGHRVTHDRQGQSNSRGVGWEYLHLAIDDHSRIAYSEIFPDEKRASCLAFLFNALRYFRSLGVLVHRLMTDNGTGFRSFRYAKALRLLKIRHLRTKPYTPRTNGKAERFVQTSLREWAYARTYATSDERKDELPRWLHQYNWHRPHGGIKNQTPVSRLRLTQNNLLRLHI